MHPHEHPRIFMMLMLKENLKKAISLKGMTVTSLPRGSKVPLQTLHGWLNGNQPKSIVQVKVVCIFLGLTLGELCFGEKLRMHRLLKRSLMRSTQEYLRWF